MSVAPVVITAVVLEGRSQAEVARTYGVSKGWVSKLVARYRSEGDSAFEPHSRRPQHSPRALPGNTVELIVQLRIELTRCQAARTPGVRGAERSISVATVAAVPPPSSRSSAVRTPLGCTRGEALQSWSRASPRHRPRVG